MPRLIPAAILLYALLGAAGWGTAASVPGEWLTPAEASAFEATPSYDDTLAFLRRVEARLPAMSVQFYGTSGEGRPLPVVVVSRERAFSPERAGTVGKPVVMIQNGIHPGEIDGKDASLMLLRDLALGLRPELLDAATLLIIPIYNVDGHERSSPFNRPNQDGPHRGMGFRTNASGLDLNRDFVKVASPEARALVGLVGRWRPDLHVDVHVTDGVDHDWVLTWAVAESPQLPAPVDAWVKDALPRVLAATEAAGHRCGPYVDLVDGDDPAKGFSSWVGGPRYATGYFPLRNRASILLEMHSYKPYRDRVLAVRDFLAALLAEVGRSGAALRRAVLAAEQTEAALGAADAPPSDVIVNLEQSPEADRIAFPVYAWREEPSVVTGGTVTTYRRGEVHALDVPWFHAVRPALTLPRPRGYMLLPGWPQVEERLAVHGLRVEELTVPAELDVETSWLSDPAFASRPYQGLTRVEAKVERRRETRTIPAGALWIPADQPDFEVAVQLLEPQGADSLFAWGLMSTVVERKEYIGAFVLEDFARQALKDPVVAAEWRHALEDEAFARDSRARYLWWYRHTPSWQVQEQGLYPIFRVLHPVALASTPWRGAK